MSFNQDNIRGMLASTIASLKDSNEFTEQSLFEGREALKRAFDRVRSPEKRLQAQAFGAIQAMVGALIRKGHVDQPTALLAMGELLDALVEWADSTPTISKPTFSLAPPPEGETPQANHYLKLSDNRLARHSQQEAPAKPKPQAGPAPSPFVPTHENCLGQLLVQAGKLTNEDLSRALTLQRINGRRLGEVLIAMEAVGIQTLEEALVRQRFLNTCRSVLPSSSAPARLRLDH